VKKTLLVTLLLVAISWPLREARSQGFSYAVPINGYGNATTPESAAGHALADIVRAQGMYNQATSAALVNYEQARSQYIQNQRQWTEVYLAKQRALDEIHFKSRQQARDRNARYQEYLENHPSSGLPPRLASTQLNRSTGKITWPSVLMRDSFAIQRNEIESLLVAQVQTRATSEISQAIVFKCREMHAELRHHIREMVTQDYLGAYRFLDSLSLEGRFPLG